MKPQSTDVQKQKFFEHECPNERCLALRKRLPLLAKKGANPRTLKQ